ALNELPPARLPATGGPPAGGLASFGPVAPAPGLGLRGAPFAAPARRAECRHGGERLASFLGGDTSRGGVRGPRLSPRRDCGAARGDAPVEALTPLIAEVEAELARRSAAPEWQEDAPFLLQLPGLGLMAAMTILAAIGALGRLPTAQKLAGYAGLGASVHASGKVQCTGDITKEGRGELRATMVEIAWRSVQHHPRW